MTRLAIADPSNDLTTRTRRRQRLLVIDDDPSVSIIARDLFSPDPIDVLSAETAAAGCEILRERRPDVVILDHYLPDGDGLEVFQQIRQFDSRLPVIWITARGTSDTAIEATKLGAFDFLTKPIDLDKLREQVHQAIQSRQLMLVPVEIADHATTSDSEADKLIGRCPAMQEVYKAIGHIAAHDVPALLVGEAGTGKELVARAIYQHGARATKPFLKLRCSDFSAAQLEAELFGQTANDSLESAPRPGKLELAAGGTLLLEEISAIEPALQGKLLRLIHEHKYEPVGSTESRSSDAILIFTSQHDPEVLVKSQRLRSDLYYLLSAFIVRLPSLRERREDLSLLVEHFIHRFANIHKSFGAGVVRVSHDALRLIQAYDWPGNVAELQAVLRRALIETKGTVLASDYLRRALKSTRAEREQAASIASGAADLPTPTDQTTDWPRFVMQRISSESTELYAEAIQEMERHLLREILAHTSGNQAQAARMLGITRTSLRKKIHSLGINIGRVVTSS